jgi:hypothetical protein
MLWYGDKKGEQIIRILSALFLLLGHDRNVLGLQSFRSP